VIDRFGICFVFHVTATAQALALLPLLFAHANGLVPTEARAPAEGGRADGGSGWGGGDALGEAEAGAGRGSTSGSYMPPIPPPLPAAAPGGLATRRRTG
jgi:hypothetical protein